MRTHISTDKAHSMLFAMNCLSQFQRFVGWMTRSLSGLEKLVRDHTPLLFSSEDKST